MSAESLVLLFLGGGSAGAIGAIVRLWMAARKGRLDDEGTLLERLNKEAARQGKRADAAEHDADGLRRQRDRARDLASRYRHQLVQAGVTGLDPPDALYNDAADSGPPHDAS